MYEDDIQFLGVSKPLAAPSVKPVTGFALHIERNGHEPEQRMMFRKINTNTVVVGRKPPSPNLIDSSDDTKAMFRCPVVSRSHAKFTFSDSGFLYITDTSSHHGTFVGHKIIPSEILVQVNDGDTITFGKSVNRNNEVVRPVVARIELIYQTPPRTPVSLAKPSTSGRYGLRLSNTSEEDDSSQSESSIEVSGFSDQSSDHESDIVEIPPPLAAISSVVRSYISSASTSSNVPSSSKNNLDPLSVPSLFSPSPALSDAEADRQVDGTVNQLDADIFDFGSPLPLKKSWYSARARQDQSSFSQRSEGRSKSLFGRLSDERESKRDNIHRTMRRSIMTSARRKRTGGSKSRSRSNSPMDLETPSPPSPMTKILVNSHSSSATDNSNGIRFSPPLIDLVSSLSSPPSPNPVVLDPLASNLILSPLNTPPPLPPTDFVNPIEPALPTSSQSSAAPIVGSSEVESFFAGHAEEGDVAAPDSCDVPRIAGAAPQTEPSEGSQDKQSEQEKPKDLADVFSSAWHVSVSPTSLHQHEGRTFGEAQNSSLPSMSQDKSPFSKVWVDTFTSAFRTAVSPPSLPQNEGRQEMEEHTSGDAQSSFPSLQLDIEDAVRSAFATSPPSSPSNEGRQEMDERTFSEAQTSSPSIAHSGEQAQDSDSGGRGVSVTIDGPLRESPGNRVSGAFQIPGASRLVDIRAALSFVKDRFSGQAVEASTSSATASASDAVATESSAGGITSEVYEALKTATEKKIRKIDNELLLVKIGINNLQVGQRDYTTRLDNNVNSKLAELSTLSSKVSDLQTLLDGLSSNFAATSNFELVKGDVEGIRGEVDTMRSDVDEIRNDTDGVRIDVDGVRTDVEAVRGEVDALRNDMDGARGDILRIDVDYIKDDYETVHGEMTVLQGDVGALQGDVDGMRAELSDLRKDVDDLMGEQGCDAREDFNTLQREWNDWKAEAEADAYAWKVRSNAEEDDSRTKAELNSCRDGLGIVEADIKILRRRIDTHEEEMKALQTYEDSNTGSSKHARELLDEVLKLQETSTTTLKALEDARIQAENELRIIVAMRQTVQAQAASESHQSSLKRKRADDSEDVGMSEIQRSMTLDNAIVSDGEMTSADVGSSTKSFVASDFVPVLSTTTRTTVPNADGIIIPSPKRARRIGRARRVGTVVAQTATALTIGAVATWTALAFS